MPTWQITRAMKMAKAAKKEEKAAKVLAAEEAEKAKRTEVATVDEVKRVVDEENPEYAKEFQNWLNSYPRGKEYRKIIEDHRQASRELRAAEKEYDTYLEVLISNRGTAYETDAAYEKLKEMNQELIKINTREAALRDQKFEMHNNLSDEFMTEYKKRKIAEIAETAQGIKPAGTAAVATMRFKNTTQEPFFEELQRNPVYFGAYKGEVGNVVMMSPEEYLKEANKYAGGDSYMPEKLERIRQGVKDGVEFGMPYLSYKKDGSIDGQEGRHRAVIAKELGLKEIPVAVRRRIEPDYELERAWQSGKISTEEAMQRLGLSRKEEGQ